MNTPKRNVFNSLLAIIFMTPLVGFAGDSKELDGYLCIPSYTTGYILEQSGKWSPTNFNISDQKFLLKKKEDSWTWNDFGEQSFASNCDGFDENGHIRCEDQLHEIRMNRNTLRFQVIQPYGYVNKTVKTDGILTPYFKIGTCSRL